MNGPPLPQQSPGFAIQGNQYLAVPKPLVDRPDFLCGHGDDDDLVTHANVRYLRRCHSVDVVRVDSDLLPAGRIKDLALIATGNVGCLVQLRDGTTTPVVHSVELLDWATGGPEPAALAANRDGLQRGARL